VQVRKPVAVLYLTLAAAIMLGGAVLSWGHEQLFDTVLYSLLLPGVLAGSGVLVVHKHPANRVGWLFCGFAIVTAFDEFAEGYGYLAAAHDLPVGALAEWFVSWAWLSESVFWLLILLLFPDGRLAAMRWRVVLWIGLAGIAIALPGQALDWHNGATFTAGRNPFEVRSPVVDLLLPIGGALLSIALLAAVASVGLRLRRAHGVERQQLKWFVCAAACLGLMAPLALIFWYRTSVVQLPMALALCSVPVAATIAILRYRLYDIDVVINRTLVYGALTATLAGTYLASVLLLQLLLGPLTDQSDLAVAGSTLAVAALFRPARDRIQSFVDERFYRSRYNAARTLELFNGRLREQLDLGALSADLREVVRDTMQPAHVSVWLAGARR
jgi:hypothetical protein